MLCFSICKMRLDGEILNLRERAGCDVWDSWSDHARMMVE